ncbi:hypothetical protein DFJ74DRAFT_675074 [Hyaloraphidium curvatum]|nr:hypothetical protein DFJ74DRAFT_675074 [Hyaloraphidium curvatum]
MRGDFAVYSRYIAHYHRLSPALRRIAEWNTAFENDLRRTGGVGGVAEMWFLPVQRVMRYGMVLGAILKTTKSLDAALEAPDGPKPPPYQPPHPDIPSLNQAISQCVALSDVVNSIQARSEKREAAAKLPDIEGWDARELGFGEMPGGQDRLVEFEGEGTEDLLGPVRVWVATDLLAIAVVATPDGRLAKASAAKGKESWRLWRALDVRDLALEQGANGKVRVKFGDRQRGDGSSTYPRAYKPRSSIGRPPEPAPMGEERSYAFEMANERARRGFEEALRAVIAAAKARPLPEGNWYAVKARAGSLDAKDMSAIPGFRSSDPFVVVRLVSKWPSAPRDVAPVAAPGVYRMDATGSTYVVPKDGQTGGEVLDPRERLQFLGRSQTVYKSLSPSFAEFGFFLPPYAAGSKLQIEVWDEDEDTKSDFIGAVRVGADELLGSRGLSWGIVNEAERDRRRKAGENVGRRAAVGTKPCSPNASAALDAVHQLWRRHGHGGAQAGQGVRVVAACIHSQGERYIKDQRPNTLDSSFSFPVRS